MAVRVTSWLFRPALLKALIGQVRLVWRLLREPVVPLLAKLLPIAAGLYVLSPIDIVPDVLPIVGQLDDLTLLLVSLEAFLKLCPANAVDFHRSAIAQRRSFRVMPHDGEIIDVQFRYENAEGTDKGGAAEKRTKII